MRRFCALAIVAGLPAVGNAQLITAYTGDEGGDRSWFIDVETGEDVGGVLGGFQALATDPSTNRIFASSGRNLDVYDVISGEAVQDGSPRLVVDQSGERVQSITSFAWGNGQLYAYHTGLGDAPGGIYVIDIETRIETDRFPQVPAELILPLSALPLPQPIDFVAEGNVAGLTFDTDRGELLIGVKKYEEVDGIDEGEPGPADEFENFIGNDILALDAATREADLVVEVPFTLGEGGFDGMAYGRDRIFLDCGAPCGNISIYNRVTGEFEQEIGAPNRFGNGSGGAAFLEAVAPDAAPTQRQVQINAIDFDAGIVEIFNFSNASQGLSGWRFCSHDFDQQRRYTSASSLSGVSIPAGSAIRVYFNDNAPPGDPSAINLSSLGGDFASPLDQDAFAIQLFFPDENGNVSFGNSSQIADHIQWNINGADTGLSETRTGQAVDEGLWSETGDFVATLTSTQRIELADRSGNEAGRPDEYNLVNLSDEPCNAADIAQPFGVLDGADVNAFISAFGAGCP